MIVVLISFASSESPVSFKTSMSVRQVTGFLPFPCSHSCKTVCARKFHMRQTRERPYAPGIIAFPFTHRLLPHNQRNLPGTYCSATPTV